MGEPADVPEALRVLEMWIPVDPSTAVQALALQPGDKYLFRYSNFKEGAPPIDAVVHLRTSARCAGQTGVERRDQVNRKERLKILERELVQQPRLLNVAPAVRPGETLLVSYFEEIGPSIDGDMVFTAPDAWFKHEELSYKEVRFALARLTLQGVVR